MPDYAHVCALIPVSSGLLVRPTGNNQSVSAFSGQRNYTQKDAPSTGMKWGVGVDYRDGEASAALERYYPGARIGLTVGENTVGAALVFRF